MARHENKLKTWFAKRPMSKRAFAKMIGVTPSYISQLCRDHNPPWPKRDVARRIGIATEGEVTPNDLAGYPPPALAAE